MMTTMYQTADGEIHETGPIDWENGVVPAACQTVEDGTRADLITTQKGPTCEECEEIGSVYAWQTDD